MGDVEGDSLKALLAAEGVEPGEGALTVVLTDDYLRDELAEINRAHLERRAAHGLLARPVWARFCGSGRSSSPVRAAAGAA